MSCRILKYINWSEKTGYQEALENRTHKMGQCTGKHEGISGN